MTPLIKFHPSISFSTEIVNCFVASEIKKTSKQKLEEYENITIIKMDFKKVLKKIIRGEITDSKTICAVLTYLAKNKNY